MANGTNGTGAALPVSAAELKKRFGKWAVPRAADFAALIDLAATTVDTGAGLEPALDGKAQVKLVPGVSGLTRSKDGLAVHVAQEGGLWKGQDGKGPLQVQPANATVVADMDGVKVQAVAPLKADDQGVHLAIGDGLTWQDEGSTQALRVKVDNQSLVAEAPGVRVQCAAGGGLTFDTQGRLVVDIGALLPTG
ncbi:hypothetical protein [Burkholderia stagnalis]|nr:hypothetical protein [Burkholderia stagnalis]